MRILYHHRTLGDGAEGVHIRETVEALRALGHSVRVVSLIGEHTNTATPQTKRWKMLSRVMPSWAYEFAELGYNVVGTHMLLRTIDEFHPHFIYDRYNSYSTAALRASRRSGLPMLLEVNGPVAYERTAYAYMQLKLPWLARRYEHKICASADRVLAVSTSLKEYLVRECGVSPERISVLHNAITPHRFSSHHSGETIRRRYALMNQTVIGFVGSLRAWHGIDLLMQVIPEVTSKYARCHFLIVGAGELDEQFRQYVQKARLDHKVTFTGWISQEEVPNHIAAMDITLMPNSNFYGSPIKVFEYMAMAKPTIAPRLGPLEEIIEHDVSGILIEPESKEALSNAILGLLNDPPRRNELGLRAREDVLANHTWEKNAERIISISKELLASRHH